MVVQKWAKCPLIPPTIIIHHHHHQDFVLPVVSSRVVSPTRPQRHRTWSIFSDHKTSSIAVWIGGRVSGLHIRFVTEDLGFGNERAFEKKRTHSPLWTEPIVHCGQEIHVTRFKKVCWKRNTETRLFARGKILTSTRIRDKRCEPPHQAKIVWEIKQRDDGAVNAPIQENNVCFRKTSSYLVRAYIVKVGTKLLSRQ